MKCKATLRNVSIPDMHFVISAQQSNSHNLKSISTQIITKDITHRWENVKQHVVEEKILLVIY